MSDWVYALLMGWNFTSFWPPSCTMNAWCHLLARDGIGAEIESGREFTVGSALRENFVIKQQLQNVESATYLGFIIIIYSLGDFSASESYWALRGCVTLREIEQEWCFWNLIPRGQQSPTDSSFSSCLGVFLLLCHSKSEVVFRSLWSFERKWRIPFFCWFLKSRSNNNRKIKILYFEVVGETKLISPFIWNQHCYPMRSHGQFCN